MTVLRHLAPRIGGDKVLRLVKRDTLLHNLRQGEILPAGRTGEHEGRMIEDEKPDFLQKLDSVQKLFSGL